MPGVTRNDPADHCSDLLSVAALMLALRALGIFDTRVLKAVETVPRQLFVPASLLDRAWEDRAIPVGHGQTLGAPSTVATMAQALEVGDRHLVLEIGTGTGYLTAILARLGRRVTTIDRYPVVVREAEARWKAIGIGNISALVGEGMNGWPRQAPFDRILVAAALERAPSRLVAQLAEGGILIAPIGRADHALRLTLFRRDGESVATRDLGAVRLSPNVLEGAAL